MLIKLNPNQNPIPVDIPTSGATAPRVTVVPVTTSTVAAYGTLVAADPTAANLTVTLPLASSVTPTGSNFVSVINNSDSANQVLIVPSGGDTINGSTSFVLAARESVTLVSDGVSEWLATPNGRNTIDLAVDFGGVADAVFAGGPGGSWSGTDNTTALQNALNALKAAGGGTLTIKGKFYCRGPLTYTNDGTNDQTVTIKGYGSDSCIIIDAAATDDFLTVDGFDEFSILGVVFFGAIQSAHPIDCKTAIKASNVKTLRLAEGTTFIGLGAADAIVQADTCGIRFDDTKVLGCSVANVALGNGAVSLIRWQQGDLSGCRFYDFGNLFGINFSKTPAGMPAFIAVQQGTTNTSIGAPGGGSLDIRGCSFDEGGTYGIKVTSDGSEIKGVRISGCSFLIGGNASVYIAYGNGNVVEDCSFNCNNHAQARPVQVEGNYGPIRLANLKVIKGGASGSSLYLFDIGLTGSPLIELVDVDYDAIYNVFPGALPTIFVTKNGIRSRLRLADSAIPQYALVKLSTTAGHVTLWLHTDSPSLITGVAQTASGGAGSVITVVEQEGVETKMLSDGTTTISPGDEVCPSATVDGRVMKGSTNAVGVATTAAGAMLDAQVGVL